MTNSASPAQTSSGVGLTIENVNASYGANHVLRDVNLNIAPGELFAFLGPSGCGKTTLLRLIAGFGAADSGRVMVGGEDIGGRPPWKRDVGMVFQSYALWPHMSVRRNVAFGLEERRLPRAEIERRVAEALDLVGLSAMADRRPSQLSGGQQQRVALARTIAVRPKILLLDEPLSNLDAKLRVQVRRELRELQQRLGLTTIFVTHDQEEANTICDRIAVMNDGVVQQVGAPIELYRKPQNLFVAGFLGAANILAGEPMRIDGRRFFRIPGAIDIAVDEAAPIGDGDRLMFRPQDAELVGADAAGAVPGVIAHREFLGAAVRYDVALGDAHILVDAPFRAGAALREPGESVAIRIPIESALWLKN